MRLGALIYRRYFMCLWDVFDDNHIDNFGSVIGVVRIVSGSGISIAPCLSVILCDWIAWCFVNTTNDNCTIVLCAHSYKVVVMYSVAVEFRILNGIF